MRLPLRTRPFGTDARPCAGSSLVGALHVGALHVGALHVGGAHAAPRRTSERLGRRSGSALLLALLVLLILLAIMAQLVFGTKSDADVARNDISLTTMDLAIESALLEVFDKLKTDGESSAGASGAAGGAGADPTGAAANPAGAAGAAGAGGGEAQGAVDSREDPWGRAQRTTINEIELRIVVQDEDAKLNVLGMLATNEDEAEKCFERVQRTFDAFREGTDSDVDASSARAMAEALRDYMKDRTRQVLPKPRMLADDEKTPDLGLVLSLEEIAVLDEFDESLFRDFREPDGRVVHSLGSFLTTWTSVGAAGGASSSSGGQSPTGGAGNSGGAAGAGDAGASGDAGAPGQSGEPGDVGDTSTAGAGGAASGDSGAGQSGGQAGSGGTGGNQGGAGGGPGGGAASAASKYGVAVNVNTAPAAVLKSLIDDRDIPGRFWDKVIEYRNLEEEPEDGESTSSDEEIVYDEYGEPLIQRQVFDSLDELRDVDGYENLDGAARARLDQLLTTESQVFSIYVTARKRTGDEERSEAELRDPAAREDLIANTLTRTVRCVVWRRKSGDNVVVVPLLRWEVLDYVPLVVEDYPDERR
ncbi:MAG: type II secretion system protein GspK [Planctomycetes bacterium]|nr:type II secretion system protein GspK [Planctomycetota bacterium]